MKSLKKFDQNTSGKGNYLNDWKKITSAPNLSEALIEHFSFLADSPGYKDVLSRIMNKATAAKISGKNLEVIFPDESMIATPPMKDIPKQYPKSFAVLLRMHETVTFYRILGEHNKFRLGDGWFEEPEDLNAETQPFADAENLICPIADPDGDFWIYHPKKKNADGEPVICFLDHESGEVDYEEISNAGSVFLKSCAKLLKLTVNEKIKHLKKSSITKTLDKKKKTITFSESGLKTNAEYQQWWNSLDKEWKTFFKNRWKISNPSLDEIKDILKADTICLVAKDNIKTLEPLRAMTALEVIHIYIPVKIDFSPLLVLPQIKVIYLDFTCIKSFTFLKNAKNLRHLGISNTAIKDISDIIWFKRLTGLDLSGTRVQDIKVLSKLPHIDFLRIWDTKISIESIVKLQESKKMIEIDSDFHFDKHQNFDHLIKFLKSHKSANSSKNGEEALTKFVLSEIECYLESPLSHVNKLISAYQLISNKIPTKFRKRFEELTEQRLDFKKHKKNKKL